MDIAIGEERLKHSVSGNVAERNAVLRAERELEEGHHGMLVHEAALKRAKIRARRARERQLVFEPQAVDAGFAKELQERPDQLRAVFVEGSMLRDHIANVAYKKETGEYELTAEIDARHPDDVIEKAVGGKRTTYEMDLPANYGSWASGSLGAITARSRTVDGVTIQFTPRSSGSGTEAPHSERGILRMRGGDPAALVAQLEKRGLAESACEAVPYDSIYRGKHRYGRVAPLHESLASGAAALELPDGHMVLHGLTGAGEGTGAGGDAVKHFAAIVESGGLKSIAERRRQGIAGMTMSPLGDIASGIDMGVPCKIGDHTKYGGSVFFGMNPEVLSRRDLWFSDRDFGGGHDRQPEYLEYAKKLGQHGLHEPCPVEGRQRHLSKSGGLARSDNEVYFEGDVSWNDVDTLFVTGDVGARMQETVHKFQLAGLLPPHLRVAIAGTAPRTSPKSSSAGKSRARVSASGWTVTEDGQVVLAKAIEEESDAPKSWSINDHIQHRARQLARLAE